MFCNKTEMAGLRDSVTILEPLKALWELTIKGLVGIPKNDRRTIREIWGSRNATIHVALAFGETWGTTCQQMDKAELLWGSEVPW